MRYLENRITLGALCLAAALLLGTIALVIIGHNVRAVADRPTVQRQLDGVTSVVVAAKDIQRGQRITSDMLSMMSIAGPRPVGGFGRAEEVAGGVALTDIKTSQLVLRNSVQRDAFARPGLSILVPPGKRAVAIHVNDEVAVGNFVRPDDRVDIELVIPDDKLAKLRGKDVRTTAAGESRVLLQNIQVLSVGEALAVDQDNRAIRMQNLTVAVTPDQALVVALAKQVGRFYLALRHPSDEADVKSTVATTAELLIGGGSTRVERQVDPKPRHLPDHRVLVIEGMKYTYQTVE